MRISRKTSLFLMGIVTACQIEPRIGQRMYHFKEFNPNSADSLAYCQAKASLYNQDDILETLEFKKALPNDQNDLLEKHFNKKLFGAYATSLKDKGSSALPFVLTAAVLYYIYSIRNRPAQAPNAVGPQIPNAAGLAVALAFQQYLGNMANEGLSSAELALKLFKKLYITEVLTDFFDKTEIEYVRNKQDIPKAYQEFFEKVFVDRKCKPEWEDDHYIKMLQLAVNLPIENKEIAYNQQLIDKAFAGYDQETQLDLKRYCIRHVAACTENNVRKIAAYFHGKPGVGKTRAAHLIAQSLGLKLKKFSLADLTMEKLVGTEEEPGLLLTILCENTGQQKNYKNIILLIDDADRVLLSQDQTGIYSFLLTLLEPETKSFYSPFLGVEIDISSLGIILAGNSDITEPALRSRLHIVHFGDHTNEYKKQVVWEELFPSMLATHKKAKLQLTEQDFTQEDTDAINTLIESDEDPGFRSIKLKLTKYIEDKVLSKHFPNNHQEEAPAQAA